MIKTLLAGVAMALALTEPAVSETLKIGFMASLTGPMGSISQDARDGFLLAVEQHGGKLGGMETEVVVEDDSLKPELAVSHAQKFIESDEVHFVVGMISSNILQAVFQPIAESETFMIGVNAGTSIYAGSKCSPFFFSTSSENNQVPETMGKHAQDAGHKRIVMLVPNYQAGRDAVEGFRRHYRGEVLEEMFVPIGHLDFASELSRIRALEPDALLVFMPGAMGVTLVRQFKQSGMAESLPFLSVWTVDETTLPATQQAAVGLYSASQWAPDFNIKANLEFVRLFKAKYGRSPSAFAAQAYDAALLIDSAVATVGHDLADKDKLRQALRAANFASTRGSFRYNTNHFPIQDYYLVQAEQLPDGSYATAVKEKVFEDHADLKAADCPMSATPSKN
jgi:branched-chain amino acid transport system substrate-binding protein